MSKKPRTPLSQGILASADHNTYRKIHSSNERSQTPPNIADESEDTFGTPRKRTPIKTAASSSRPKSITELALSDIECKPERRRHAVTSEVVVVETDDLNTSGEVRTRSFRVQTPVKVIRHSPSPSPTNHASKNNSKSNESKMMASIEDSKMITFIEDNSSYSKKDSSLSKRKKKTHTVQSRYKQQATKKTDKQHETIDISAIAPSEKPLSNQKKKKSTRVTSTPFLMTSMYEKQAPSYDGSILDQTNEPPIKEALVKKSNRPKKEMLQKKDSSRESTRETKTYSSENDQLFLDLHYARLLQASYLSMKTHQTFEKQEGRAKREIYNLWVSNRKLEKEIETLKLSVNQKKIEMAVDQLINCQVDKLKPLSNLVTKCSRLHEALSNTSHYMPISDVIINEDSLLTSLDESKRLLASITSLTRHNSNKIEEISSTSDVLMKTVKGEIDENQRCHTLFNECNSMLNYERSLQVQLIENQQHPPSFLTSFAAM